MKQYTSFQQTKQTERTFLCLRQEGREGGHLAGLLAQSWCKEASSEAQFGRPGFPVGASLDRLMLTILGFQDEMLSLRAPQCR